MIKLEYSKYANFVGNFLKFLVSYFQVLNETSLWWFDRTRHITQNAIVSAPDKNVTIAKKCSVFPVEFVGKYEFLNV